MFATLLGHAANLAFAAAFLVRTMAVLRALSIAGCLLAAGYQYAAPAEPLWTGIAWNLAFCALNAVALARRAVSNRGGNADAARSR